ncbi:HopJ type III effector protein [Colwellia asteriadis]|uniref:HopJ type III effector protein n=1 Tax=Colwellia asteriadis TaxID=517723 RepID=A0ABN1L882_9GAMM
MSSTISTEHSLASLLDALTAQANSPQEDIVSFEQVMQVIAQNYHYSPVTFTNGTLLNEAGTNEGSCKIFAFAQLNQLTEPQTLACFGRFYREDVLAHPQGEDHGNIRNFIKTGWAGINFNAVALTAL